MLRLTILVVVGLLSIVSCSPFDDRRTGGKPGPYTLPQLPGVGPPIKTFPDRNGGLPDNYRARGKRGVEEIEMIPVFEDDQLEPSQGQPVRLPRMALPYHEEPQTRSWKPQIPLKPSPFIPEQPRTIYKV